MIKPLQDFVLVQKRKPDEITASGIILSADRDEEQNLATVIDVGEKVTLPIKSGDVVIIQYGFDDFKYKDSEYSLGREEHVRAIIND